MKITHERLTLEMIERSPEIGIWLSRFPYYSQPVAIDLLLKLRFIKRDIYAEWLKEKLGNIGPGPCAVYAVRKFEDLIDSYWDSDGKPRSRPADSLGSEDLVQSVLANFLKAGDTRYLDHPSIEQLRQRRVRQIVLIDDSIGSGQRVADFIDLFMRGNRTLNSWWSYGLIEFYVVALIRTHSAEERILECLPGSDHPKRVHRRSEKLHFICHYHFDDEKLRERWGENVMQIMSLCDSVDAIPRLVQRGYGGVMSNQIFYHSVPDNTPGILWSNEGGWEPLFLNRSFPLWLAELLAGKMGQGDVEPAGLGASLMALLLAVKRGIRLDKSISRAIGLDPTVTAGLILRAQAAGLLNHANRLTKAGEQAIWDNKAKRDAEAFDRSLYVPKQWCVGRGTIQPSNPGGIKTRPVQAESKASLLVEDGDAGQASLERTDARPAAPSLDVITQLPSGPRMGDDVHGPKGESE